MASINKLFIYHWIFITVATIFSFVSLKKPDNEKKKYLKLQLIFRSISLLFLIFFLIFSQSYFSFFLAMLLITGIVFTSLFYKDIQKRRKKNKEKWFKIHIIFAFSTYTISTLKFLSLF